MKRFVVSLTLLLLPVTFGCGRANTSSSPEAQASGQPQQTPIRESSSVPPRDWRLVNACGITFYVPADVREVKVQGIDSCVERYRNEDTLFTIDVVMYTLSENASRSREYSDKRDFRLERLRIDGRTAEIITRYNPEVPAELIGLNHEAVLFVPRIGDDKGNLTIWAHSRSVEGQAIAQRVFESVRFGK